MSYAPFCSVEIAFGNMQTLHDLINACSAEKKTLVICDRFTTDLWKITQDIEANVAVGNMVWIDHVPGNPTQREIVDALTAVKGVDPKEILAIGGGSTIDLAKGVSNFYELFKGKDITIEAVTELLRNGSYKVEHPVIDLIAVPSAAGTGSEVTQFATIWDVNKQAKFSIDTPQNYPKKSVIIPELTLTLPARLTFSTGIDALSHAIESFWAKPTTYLVKDVALRAIDMIMTYLPEVLADPSTENDSCE